ncbi:hypothetical protein PISL3812_06370 [Talaromyces islandicus]|uniref:Uncharacterized protein n=1 Tax=Talaromyces islandicus TaxID=28573 RepID=A0A0U1M1G6_TALIS|nr:hypothetical protein PISL3812_06370 [Talaromyces islandicus]
MIIILLLSVGVWLVFRLLGFAKPGSIGIYLIRDTSPKRKLAPGKQPIVSLPGKPTQESIDALLKYKRLYHQLHNLEKHPSVVPEARDELISLFAEVISEAKHRGRNNGILKMDTFDAQTLSIFLLEEERKITSRLEKYAERRKTGAPRELFQTLEEARTWLIQRAPSKLVDGAWLGHIHKVATSFDLRGVTKNAWQVMSEELGDGDLAKNHAAIYWSLMEKIGANLPQADSVEFVEAECGLEGNPDTWKSAVAQLLISLFPKEFMPEILGFNLQFECLTWDTVRAFRELKELGLDDYYFLLHISIDNSDSGHAAMALKVVIDYLRHVQATSGNAAMQKAWRGVQVGYLLSEKFAAGDEPQTQISVYNRFAGDLVRIFRAKVSVSARLHCASRVKIGSKKLSEWLSHQDLETEQGQAEFLIALSKARPWIRAGNSTSSRLVSAFEWNGKMFGALTETELGILKNWIDSLATDSIPEPSTYWNFVERAATPSEEALQDVDVREDCPVFSERGLSTPWNESHEEDKAMVGVVINTIAGRWALNSTTNVPKLLSMWFAHSCLLQDFIAIPIRTGDTSGSAVVRVLRAQRGFASEGEGVAGMDELRRADCIGLVEMGLEMARNAGIPRPRNLKDVVSLDCEFAIDMLHWSRRPMQHRDALLGMAWAFVQFHESLAAGCELLSENTRDALRIMAKRERAGLEVCKAGLAGSPTRVNEFESAVWYARNEIDKCFT